MKPEEIITDEEIVLVHGKSDFGGMNSNKREIVNEGLLKFAIGYGNGSTLNSILETHKLIIFSVLDKRYYITRKGREYMCAVYKESKKTN